MTDLEGQLSGWSGITIAGFDVGTKIRNAETGKVIHVINDEDVVFHRGNAYCSHDTYKKLKSELDALDEAERDTKH